MIAQILVLLAAGAVHSPLDFEVSLGSSIEDDDAGLDDLLTVEDDASLEDAFADAFADAAATTTAGTTMATTPRSAISGGVLATSRASRSHRRSRTSETTRSSTETFE